MGKATKPSVTMFYDVENWAFHNIARNISEHSTDKYVFQIYGREHWFGHRQRLIDILSKSDIVVFLWRFDLLAALDVVFGGCSNREVQKLKKLFFDTSFVTVVYDHLYHSAEDLRHHGDPFELSDITAVCSRKLLEIYTDCEHLPNPEAVLIDGVDTGLFDKVSAKKEQRPIAFGWVGNSAWGSTFGDDMKGLRTIAQPAVEQLRAKGFHFDFVVADSVTSPREKSSMPAYYNEIDVLLCTSKIEGTPNPILEAMASGCAFISTDVGIVREVSGPLQKSAILTERTPEAFAEKMREFIERPEEMNVAADENYHARTRLDWGVRFQDWDALFVKVLASVHTPEHRISKQRQFEVLLAKRMSMISRLRSWVARSVILHKIYRVALKHCPRLIRGVKNMLMSK